jgi:hypothetical protein
MDRQQLQSVLKTWDQQGRYVFSKHELTKLFPDDNTKALVMTLNRHTQDGFISRTCRSVYINKEANSFDPFTLERITIVLRGGYYNYVSLELALSEYGAISQILTDRLTIMTTGRKGIFQTPYGILGFTHTGRSVENILQNTVKTASSPLRIATKETAWRDLKRVGRNINLVNKNEVANQHHHRSR